jgi:hypothetical protein
MDERVWRSIGLLPSDHDDTEMKKGHLGFARVALARPSGKRCYVRTPGLVSRRLPTILACLIEVPLPRTPSHSQDILPNTPMGFLASCEYPRQPKAGLSVLCARVVNMAVLECVSLDVRGGGGCE